MGEAPTVCPPAERDQRVTDRDLCMHHRMVRVTVTQHFSAVERGFQKRQFDVGVDHHEVRPRVSSVRAPTNAAAPPT
jgi:hypothetical protein